MYQVLARKWRPQNFDTLVGQRHVARALTNAIESDRLAHAYLFAGLRGSGKTTVARILAKCLNCEQGSTATPCDQCASCLEVAESRSIDVMEIDAASRTKVEQTRELLEVVSYAPARDRNKILIIDEAHMLSKASFNALLKTLEEPPPNVVFVLATTEIQKVLPTILSRCQVFEFRRVTPRELLDHLRRICDAEKIQISDTALDKIARAGEGSVRDSLSVLERVLAFCGAEASDDDVLRVLGAVRTDLLTDTIAALARHDAAGLLARLDELADEGHDLVHFWSELIAALRDLLLVRTVPDRPDLLARSEEESKLLAQAGEGLSREDLTRCFQILAELEPGLKASSQPRFLFEAAMIRLASLGHVRPIEELLAGLPAEGMTTAPAPAAPRPQKKNLSEPTPPPVPERVAPVAEAAASPPRAARTPRPDSSAPFATRLIDAVQRTKPMFAAMLEHATTIEVRGEELVLIFDESQAALAQPLERKETLQLLSHHAREVTGQRLSARIERTKGQHGDTRPSGNDDAPTRPRRPLDEAEQRKQLLDQARQEPGVRRLLKEFGAQVVEIRPHAVNVPAGAPDEIGPLEDSQ